MYAFPGSLSTIERESAAELFRNGRRRDGRKFKDFRQVQVEVDVDDQSCRVAMGSTQLVGRITYRLVKPFDNAPSEGILKFCVTCDKTSLPIQDDTDLKTGCLLVSRVLDRCFKESRSIEMESLCVIRGKNVFKLEVHLHFVSMDEALVDTAGMGALALLQIFRKPHITVNDQQITIHSADDCEPSKVTILQPPFVFCIGLSSKSEEILADPTFLEQYTLLDGALMLGVDPNMDILCAQFTTAVAYDNFPQVLQNCAIVVQQEMKQRMKILESATNGSGRLQNSRT